MNLSINSISLQNFRNYSGKGHSFDFHRKFIFIIGPNAIGKTNLLEAIQYISFHKAGIRASVRESDKLILSKNAQEPFFSVNAKYHLEERDFSLNCTSKEGKRSIDLNGVAYRYFSQMLDELPKVVTFKSKESIEIVRGTPQKRRDWLDTTISLINRRYAESLKRYSKALEQRNSLLKQLSLERVNPSVAGSQLEPWDIELSRHGAILQKERGQFLKDNLHSYKQAYEAIASETEELPSLLYEPSVEATSEEELLAIFKEKQGFDLMRGVTTIGPHKDDFCFLISDLEARHYASQGQQRTCALALKILQKQIWEQKLGYTPVLLLDDVAAELDLNRQKALFSSLNNSGQVFITTTHLVNLPLISEKDYQIINLNKE